MTEAITVLAMFVWALTQVLRVSFPRLNKIDGRSMAIVIGVLVTIPLVYLGWLELELRTFIVVITAIGGSAVGHDKLAKPIWKAFFGEPGD